ncbi:MAG: tyrosine-type recombinase/integrase [Firmicutes bacterium]|nr:tyrosine-type recombinase/integrase [Bacillota bacterium]
MSVKNTGCEKHWCKRKDIKWAPVEIRSHDLRHTYCTMLYDAGVDVKRAQELMGHDDLSVTMKIYTHLSEERSAASDRALHSYFDSFADVGKSVGKPRRYYLKKPLK